MVFPVKLFRSALVTAILFAPLGFAQSSFGVRILLGAGDQQNTRWDGSISSSDATVARLEPWRFEAADSISGSTWKMSTHPIKLFLGGIFLANASKAKSLVIANGVIVQLSDDRGGKLLFPAVGPRVWIGEELLERARASRARAARNPNHQVAR
jgi:hypothetical protein